MLMTRCWWASFTQRGRRQTERSERAAYLVSHNWTCSQWEPCKWQGLDQSHSKWIRQIHKMDKGSTSFQPRGALHYNLTLCLRTKTESVLFLSFNVTVKEWTHSSRGGLNATLVKEMSRSENCVVWKKGFKTPMIAYGKDSGKDLVKMSDLAQEIIKFWWSD